MIGKTFFYAVKSRADAVYSFFYGVAVEDDWVEDMLLYFPGLQPEY